MSRSMTVVENAQEHKTFSTIEQVRDDVNDVLRTLLMHRKAEAYAVTARYGDLWDVIERYVINSGKRVRPYLTVVGYELYGGTAYEKIIQVAAAQEILNQAFLIHDDIIDRDFVRYGSPNVAGHLFEYYQTQRGYNKTQSVHYANAAALLAGDLGIAESFMLIRKAGFSAEKILAIQDLINEAIFVVAGGEFLDSETYGLPIELSDPLTVAYLKTAVYSVIVPLLCGALVAGADELEIAKLREFGTKLGIAYQLVDDLLGVFGNEKVTGKTTIGDLREGKHTYLMQQTWQRATKEDLKVLKKLFGKPRMTETEAERIRSIISTSGAKEASEKQIHDLVEHAERIVDTLHISNDGKQLLCDFARKVTTRSA